MSFMQELSRATSAAIAGAAASLVAIRAGRTSFSGFAWRTDLIVTADEPLPEEGDIAVVLPGGAEVEARIAGRNAATDIALLRVQGASVTPARLSAAVPAAGALVLAAGAADGVPLAALGVVARVAGPWHSLRGGEIAHRIELDMRPQRRMEGGLVLDAEGQPFGMLVAGPRRRALVIPGATIDPIAERLATLGRVPRGWLGLALQPVRIEGGDGRGLMIVGVDPSGPGAAAGLHQGDVIAAWDGAPIGRGQMLTRGLGPGSIGRAIGLDIRRGGETRQVSLTIGERPEA